MKKPKFFEERTDQSEVKARIVQKYFDAWAKVIMPTASARGGKIAYIDLYAGPGRYKDGSASTPLLVLEKAIANPQMAKMLVALLNDADEDMTSSLSAEIAKLPGIKKLKFPPDVRTGPVDDSVAEYFEKTRIVPSFSFVDPFGYKGLSLKIVNGVIKDWGCDCLFFFNYTRINAGLSNPKVKKHIDALFGEKRADKLRAAIDKKSADMREALVLESLAQAIKEMGGTYVLPFRFKRASGKRTSHSLIFVSKSFKGYDIMKSIMAKESSTADQGVPSFEYSPADASMPLLMSLNRPLEKLGKDLASDYAGKKLRMVDIYEDHSVDTPYLKKNYKDVLMGMEEAGKIKVSVAEGKKRRANSFADHLIVKFP